MKQASMVIENLSIKRSDSVARKKAELQARGVQIPAELIDELDTQYNAPAIRSGRMVLCLESPSDDGELIPVFIVNGKRASHSPFSLHKNKSGKYEVRAGDEKYTDISLLLRPKFYDVITGSGIPMHKLAVIVGPGHLRSVVNQQCYYQQIGRACRFCAVQRWWDANVKKSPEEIAEAVVAGVVEGVVKHVSLTTGTLNTEGKGLEHLVETAELIHAKVDIPIMLEFEPIQDLSLLESLLKKARQAGVTTVSCNIECFDKSIRQEIMPAKGEIPVASYIQTWDKCLKIFGNNEVFTVAVVGIGEEDASILKGVEIAASYGVMTFLVPHSPAIGADYEDTEAPDADRMLALYERSVAIYRKYGLDLCACQAGCVRGSGFSTIKDVFRFGS